MTKRSGKKPAKQKIAGKNRDPRSNKKKNTTKSAGQTLLEVATS
tara:strand:+ start:1468 stop:1599 length:132 start_codon:yes stop_codon:yes gene_type:complete